MAKLPSSFRARNKTTQRFRECYAQLPQRVQRLTRLTAVAFDADPTRSTFRLHELTDTSKSRHLPGSFSVSVTMGYRAIYTLEESGVRIWYWVGSHADYDTLVGK